MIPFWNDEPALMDELHEVTELIKQLVTTANPYIRSYLIEVVRSQGKMLRPALVLMSARLGKDVDRGDAIKQAALIEMIHLASLVHDDIIDGATTRRGRPTLNSQLGSRRAVIAGDYLLARALTLITDTDQELDPAAISHALGRLCDSEISQDSEEWDFSISKTHYLRRIAGKTATLFALSGYSGALRGNCDPSVMNLMHQIGYSIGMAFQIKDDILDITGSKNDLGKAIGLDIRSGIATLPLICALEQDTDGKILKLLNKNHHIGKSKLKKVLRFIKESGGIDTSEQIAKQYFDKAFTSIGKIENREVQKSLRTMISRLDARIS